MKVGQSVQAPGIWLKCLLPWLLKFFAGLGLVVTVVTVTPLVSWYARLLAGPWENPQGATLIVLGASRMEPGIIGNDTYWRAVYALRAYRQGRFQKVLLSGTEVAASIRDFLQFQGVPAAAIYVEEQSLSTRENALYARRAFGDFSVPAVLLTSDYHMFRARRAFARCGLAVLPHPIPDAVKRAGRWTDRWSVFLDEVIESVKIGYYFARGWIRFI
jgi:uncharacterized SAM-binding protein YcdF (DUF218 family)